MEMKAFKYIMIAATLLSGTSASAQNTDEEKFVARLTADIYLGKPYGGKFTHPDIRSKSSMSPNIGLEFGYKVWEQDIHSIHANIGLGYRSTSLTATAPDIDFHYDAPATADMDNETYIRYYEMEGIHQKINTSSLTVPIFADYNYKLNEKINLQAIFGFRFCFNVSAKIVESIGKTYCYGIYPQYDNLMIDASYLNEFGSSSFSTSSTMKPEINGMTASIFAGFGAEYNIYGPYAVALTIRYEAGLSSMFKGVKSNGSNYDSSNAPATYTVAEGQKIRSLSSYLTGSKISAPAIALSVVYRF